MTTEASSESFAPAPEPGEGDRVVIGISGGVDSAVAALLLRRRGCEVIAVTTKNFCFDEAPFSELDLSGSCCSADAIGAAGDLCAQLDISHSVLDLTSEFGSSVIDDYVDRYAEGLTPNPCVRCNQQVRFPELLAFADRVDAQWVASGHYARRVDIGSQLYLQRGRDDGKDQSYYLSRLPRELLSRLSFPLGALNKTEVREIAAEAGLITARAPDSQELCFVPDGDRSVLLGSHSTAGDIVDESGNKLGRHDGIPYYTPGQRRGLGIAHPEPLYVVELRPESNEVVVGPESSLHRHEIFAKNAWLDDFAEGQKGLVARTRARHPGVELRRLDHRPGHLKLELAAADRAPAPGQALVLYRNDVVVGGGDLAAAAHEDEGMG
jgi:tRNA-specific 2-thiouridylase